MSPNGTSSGFDRIFILSSSDSSDSESLLKEDIKNSGSQINEQWEAIERTLYQEPGQQVTDSELLKECKLWRDTFPHFRVRGTKIDVKQTDHLLEEADKSIQTLKKHFDLNKLEEKRKNIKTKVVGMLVDRLITKYGLDKGSTNSEGNVKSGVQLTEIDDDVSNLDELDKPNKSPENVLNMPFLKNPETPAVVSTDNESYFERGKLFNRDDQDEEDLREILASWEEDNKTARKLPKSYRLDDLKKFGNKESEFMMKCTDNAVKERINDFKKFESEKKELLMKRTETPFKEHINDFKKFENKKKEFLMKCTKNPVQEQIKRKKTPPAPSLVGNLAKPFEMTKKIDKKYNGLVDKIFERRSNELETTRHCRTSASSMDVKYLEDSLEKLRIGSAFDDYVKRTSQMRINKFDNNWLKRRELNSDDGFFPPKKSQNAKAQDSAKLNLNNEESQDEMDDKFIENLRKELALKYKRPPKRTGVIEQINLRRPKPFRPGLEKTPKSFSCGDLQKRNKKETKSRQPKAGLGLAKNESNVKKNVRFNNSKGTINTNQNALLPPIETGIICTELTGRPKIGVKIPPKRF